MHMLVRVRLALPGASPKTADRDGFTVLHWAAWNGQLAAVRLLVARNAPLNAADRHGCTPLHRYGQVRQTVQLQLEADFLRVGRYVCRTPCRASMDGHAAVVSCLLEAGADPNVAAADGSMGGIQIAYACTGPALTPITLTAGAAHRQTCRCTSQARVATAWWSAH